MKKRAQNKMYYFAQNRNLGESLYFLVKIGMLLKNTVVTNKTNIL